VEKPSSNSFERIVTPDDPRVADYRAVSDPELLRSKQLFVAEGRLVVARLLEDRRWNVRSVLVNEAARRDLAPILAAASSRVPILVCEAADFLGITGHHIHRGCLALVERPPALSLGKALAESRLAVALEGVANADNVGGIFRNLAAFGADLAILSPACCSPLYRKAIRTSMAATLRVPFIHAEEWPAPLARLRQAGFTIAALVAASAADGLEMLDAFASRPPSAKLALLVGSEGSGLTSDGMSFADHLVHIPIAPEIDSLNVAVATGIALEQLTRASRARGILGDRTEPRTT
jgi:tRNA G18 (ribose-2'-O)-methylase SpoU